MTDEEKAEIVNTLDAMILKLSPKTTKVAKYGGVLYTLKPEQKEGQFCGTFVYAAHVQLSFSDGVQLEDPQSVLQGNGKSRRHLSWESLEEIDSKIITPLLEQAVKYSLQK